MISLSGPHRRSLSAIVACLCGLLLAGAVALVSPYVATAAAAGPAAPLALTSQAANPPALVALQQAELSAGDSAANDAFGSSVAISAGTALVGAPNKNGGAGVVYVFVRSGMTWSQQVELTDPDAVARDQFGCSVALCGDTALIGARGVRVGNHGAAGAAYVFTRSETSWSPATELTASDVANDDNFGDAVALSGTTALIGACNKSFGDNYYTGAAYFFSGSGESWAEQAELPDPNPGYTDDFGYAVALSGDSALISAPGTSVSGQYWAGAAYLFTFSNGSWNQQAELTASDGAAGDDFGNAVALSGDTALIGAVATLNWTGTAYVFAGSGASWTQEAELSDPEADANDNYGVAVALDSDTALVGACLKTVGTQSADGVTFVFTPSGGTWSQQAQISAADGAANDNLGDAVALSGDTALVGAPNHGGVGAVYVEQLSVGFHEKASVRQWLA